MAEHVDRMVVELRDLKEKIAKLTAFMLTDTYGALGRKQKHLMIGQAQTMLSYQSILTERLYLAALDGD